MGYRQRGFRYVAVHAGEQVVAVVASQLVIERVAAARALIGQPELVIADEPTSALDADAREAFLQLLFAECRGAGASLLFVSHDQSLATLFDRSLSLAELNRAAKPVEV